MLGELGGSCARRAAKCKFFHGRARPRDGPICGAFHEFLQGPRFVAAEAVDLPSRTAYLLCQRAHSEAEQGQCRVSTIARRRQEARFAHDAELQVPGRSPAQQAARPVGRRAHGPLRGARQGVRRRGGRLRFRGSRRRGRVPQDFRRPQGQGRIGLRRGDPAQDDRTGPRRQATRSSAKSRLSAASSARRTSAAPPATDRGRTRR